MTVDHISTRLEYPMVEEFYGQSCHLIGIEGVALSFSAGTDITARRFRYRTGVTRYVFWILQWPFPRLCYTSAFPWKLG